MKLIKFFENLFSLYSIKKFLSIIFSLLVIYLAIFTDKNYYDILLFIAGLLAIRSFDKTIKQPEQ